MITDAAGHSDQCCHTLYPYAGKVIVGTAGAANFSVQADSTDNPGIFPNPVHADSRVRVVVPGNEQALVTISDVTGKIVKTLKLSGTGEIDPGGFFLRDLNL